jgi:hypothetical protein
MDGKVLRSKGCGRGHTPAFSLELGSVWAIFALGVVGAVRTSLVTGLTRQACRAYEDCREADRWWGMDVGIGTGVRLVFG